METDKIVWCEAWGLSKSTNAVVDVDDLHSIGMIAVWKTHRPLSHNFISTVARRAMIDELRLRGSFRRNGARLHTVELGQAADVEILEPDHDFISLDLTPQERWIATAIACGLKQCEVAAQLGFHESRITQILKKAKRRLEED